MGNVHDLWQYPVKGMAGVNKTADGLRISPTVGVIGDRQFALKQRASVPDTWAPKGMFYVGMNTPAIVAEHPFTAYLDRSHDRFDEKPAQGYRAQLARKLDIESELHILDTKQAYNLTDDQQPYVSFLNHATLHHLEKFLEHNISAQRFRMNVILEGFPPLEELSWVDGFPGTKEFQVGEVRFRIEDACERCKAIEAHPSTGTYNMLLRDGLSSFMEAAGYKGSPHRGKMAVMGFLARPLNAGVIRWHDEVTPPE